MRVCVLLFWVEMFVCAWVVCGWRMSPSSIERRFSYEVTYKDPPLALSCAYPCLQRRHLLALSVPLLPLIELLVPLLTVSVPLIALSVPVFVVSVPLMTNRIIRTA